MLGERARRHQTSIAAGLVLRSAAGSPSAGWLDNASVLFGPDGSVVGRTAKAFLWHFDSTWFAPGARARGVRCRRRARRTAGVRRRATARDSTLARGRRRRGDRGLHRVGVVRPRSRRAQLGAGRLRRARTRHRERHVGRRRRQGRHRGATPSSMPVVRESWIRGATGSRRRRATAPASCCYTLDLDAAPGPPVSRRPALYADAAVERSELSRGSADTRAADPHRGRVTRRGGRAGRLVLRRRPRGSAARVCAHAGGAGCAHDRAARPRRAGRARAQPAGAAAAVRGALEGDIDAAGRDRGRAHGGRDVQVARPDRTRGAARGTPPVAPLAARACGRVHRRRRGAACRDH